jgi:hypothetical protein
MLIFRYAYEKLTVSGFRNVFNLMVKTILFVCLLLRVTFCRPGDPEVCAVGSSCQNLPTKLTEDELEEFNGTVPGKRVLLSYRYHSKTVLEYFKTKPISCLPPVFASGVVYDVSSERATYEVGGSYAVSSLHSESQ